MIVEKSLKKCNLTLEGDALPKANRQVKTFRRLIAAIRATEAEVLEELSKSQSELNAALQANLELQERCHRLASMLTQHKLAERLSAIDTLTTADRNLLLEVSREPEEAAAA